MTRADEKDRDPFHVPFWTDTLSAFVTSHPRMMIGLGGLETRAMADDLAGISVERPVYVTGLPRAGSTILLEMLARHPDTATHRYRDFPAIHVPVWWNWFVDRAATPGAQARERTHLDGILVDRDSPEAFEEMLWMVFFPDQHDPNESAVLGPETRNPAFERFYIDHIHKLLRLRRAGRYLAKANYNVTRLQYLLRLFPDARFVVPFRDPVWHVASLMKQHRLFSAAAATRPRVTRHLGRSGHFEFGPGRRPINFGNGDATRLVELLWNNGFEVEGWAEYWAQTYGHLARLLVADAALRNATMLVRYESLCAAPGGVMRAILDHCDLTDQGIPAHADAVLHEPDYYTPAFTNGERATIRRHAGAALDAISRLADANAAAGPVAASA